MQFEAQAPQAQVELRCSGVEVHTHTSKEHGAHSACRVVKNWRSTMLRCAFRIVTCGIGDSPSTVLSGALVDFVFLCDLGRSRSAALLYCGTSSTIPSMAWHEGYGTD